jgi:ubiquinone/menaquinone biosynthesis C-methylase UbiE
MAHSGKFARIDAFDLSPKSIAIARDKARDAGIDNIHFFEAGFDDFDGKLGDARYDVVCFFGSLHHVREILMRLLIEVDRMLYEDAGYLPSDFHVGICRKR